MSKRILLNNSVLYAIVDDVDFELLSKYHWRLSKQGYAAAGHATLMHRIVMSTPAGKDTDHINRNKLDNRHSNLRIINRSLNALNRGGSHGVSWKEDRKKWRARIKINYKEVHLGYFTNKKEAILARQSAVKQAFADD